MQPKRMQAPAKRSNRFRARALSAAAAGLAASGAASEASATIIYSPSGASAGTPFDIDGTIYSALEILTSTGMMGDNLSLDDIDVGGMASTSTIEFAFFQQGGVGPRYLLDMTPGVDTVGDSVTYGLDYRDQAFLNRNSALHPTWNVGESGYVGFTFLQNDTTPVYGWMQLTFDSTSSATAVEWAWDDSGAPIGVGVVPEPGTALLVGLGLAMLGIAGQRARAARRADAHG